MFVWNFWGLRTRICFVGGGREFVKGERSRREITWRLFILRCTGRGGREERG
jgi:hypothetical protein